MQTWLKILLIIAAAIVVLFVVLPIVIVVIAALVFLINPTQISSTGDCAGFQKLPIGNFEISSDGLQIQITNQTGRNIEDVGIKASFDHGEYINSSQYNGDDEIVANAITTVSWTGQNLVRASHTMDLEVSYFDGDFTRTATASCRGVVN